MPDLEEAKRDVERLLTVRGISRVVYVDDNFAGFSVEEVLARLDVVSPGSRGKAAPELAGIPWDAPDEDVWKAKVRAEWDELSNASRQQIFQRIVLERSAETASQYRIDEAAASRMGSVFSDLTGLEYRAMPLAEWQTSGSNLLETSREYGTLFLFDLNFENESTAGGNNKTGWGLVQEVLSSEAAGENAVCGLVTHLVDKGQEQEEWLRESSDRLLPKEKFLIASKIRLSEDDVQGFVHMLKLTVLNKPCNQLARKVAEILGNSVEHAKQEVLKMNVFDFEDVVARSSKNEGVWEPDTLFRLFGIFVREVARHQAAGDEQVNTLVQTLRQTSHIATSSVEEPKSTSWKIRRQELYETGPHLNGFHMPIELGDIFQKNPGEKKYILIGQPCDLMVRPDGKRNWELSHVFLARVYQKLPGEDQIAKDPRRYGMVCELPYFGEGDGMPWYVRFPDFHPVSLFVLDMCVFQDDGSASIGVGDECPGIVIPAWRARHEKMKAKAGQLLVRYQSLVAAPMDAGQARDAALPRSSLGEEALFSSSINAERDRIQYGCKRVGRLCYPASSEILHRFLSYWARAALDHDFAAQAYALMQEVPDQ